MGRPLFSILVPTYNHASFLPAALDSLLAQSLSDWEAILVNDGSTDDSPAVMDRYAGAEPRFRVVHKANGGVSSALNEGLRRATGEWICWLSSDDFFEPDKLETHFREIGENPSARFFHSHFHLYDDRTGVKTAPHPGLRNLMPSVEHQLIDLFRWNYIHGNSIAVHRSVFERVGHFNENLRSGQDFDMWMRIGACFPFRFLDRRTCVTRVHSGQGTVIFPEAGIFDSTRACVEYLNGHRFTGLFPFQDLANPAHAADAACAAFDVAKNPDSFINRCGYNTALLERLNEFLVEDCTESARRAVVAALRRKTSAIRSSPLPDDVKWQVRILRNGGGSDFRFAPHDFLGEIMGNAARFATEGRREEAEKIRRYLGILRTVSDSDRVRIDAAEGSSGAGSSAGRSGAPAKILLVAHGFPTQWRGGVELYAFNFAKALRAKGHDVALLFPQDDAGSRWPRLQEGHYDGVRLYKIVCRSGVSRKFQITNPKVERLFRSILNEGRFDVVHVHHTHRLPFSLAEIAAEGGTPVCLTLHDFWFLCPCIHLYVGHAHRRCDGPSRIGTCAECISRQEPARRGNPQAIEEFLRRRQRYVRRLLEKIDIVAAPSAFVAGTFESFGFGGGKIAVAPLGLRSLGDPPIRKRVGRPLTFAHLGTIHGVKNVVMLAAAFKAVRGPAKLVFWGNGLPDEIARLKREMEPDGRIEYNGEYSPEMLAGILGSVDVVIVPSLIESYSFTVREALMAGVPVIASNAGAIPEVVVHMKNGILFDPRNGDELSRWLQAVVDDPELVDRLKEGITPVKTIAEDADGWIERYRGLRGTKPPGPKHPKNLLETIMGIVRPAGFRKSIR